MGERNDNAEIIAHAKGTVMHFKDTFGFIRPDGINPQTGEHWDDCFFHFKQCAENRQGFLSYLKGDKVEFDIIPGKKMSNGKNGYNAINVKRLSGSAEERRY